MPITKNGNNEIVYTEKTDAWDSDKTGVFAEEDFAIAPKDKPLKQLQVSIASTNNSEATVTLQVSADSDQTHDLSSTLGGVVTKKSVKALIFTDLTSFTVTTPFAPVNSYAFVTGDRLFYDGQTPDGLGGNLMGDYTASGIYVFTDNGDGTGTLSRDSDFAVGATIKKGTIIHVGEAGCDGTPALQNMSFEILADAVVGAGDIIPDGPGIYSNIPKKITKTLTSQNITDQFVGAGALAVPNTMFISKDGVVLYEGEDYTLSTNTSGVTKITFAGDYATGGPKALIAGDKLRLQYLM